MTLKDYRMPEHRWEAFWLWLEWRVRYCDLDHYEYGRVLASGKTLEEKLWYSVYFGMTYQAGMAAILSSAAPNGLEADLFDVEVWAIDTYKNHAYNKDARYNKGRFVEMLSSVRNYLGNRGYSSLTEWVTNNENHEYLATEMCKHWHKFGPMCSWLATQFFYEVAGVPLDPQTLPANYSVYTCMSFLVGDTEDYEHSTKNKRPTKHQVEKLPKFSKDLKIDAAVRFSQCRDISMYTLETHLCQFRKLVQGRDFPGHSIQNQYEFYNKLMDNWPDARWDSLSEVFEKQHKHVRRKYENKALRRLFCETGQFWFLHEDFPELPDWTSEYNLSTDDYASASTINQITDRIKNETTK